MDVAEANKKILNAGLNIKISNIAALKVCGATVISQSIPKGTVVNKNSVIELEILYLDFED